MSSRAKGRRSLNKVKEYYQQEGYLVDEVEQTGRFLKSKDLFSALCMKCNDVCGIEDHSRFPGFDLLSLKDGKIHLVQVKTNSPATQSDYKWFAKRYSSRNIYIVVVTVYDRKGLRIQRYCKNGSILEKDLRK